jgi:hypothetical protein
MESAAPSPTSHRRSLRGLELIGLLLLFGVATWLLFTDLGAASFHDGDEALYAQVAREMSASGELLTPTYWGAPLFNKPPLMYWLMTGAIEVLPGPLEWQARVPSALMGLLLIALTYGTARRLSGPWAGAGAALLLLGNHQLLFEHGLRSANLDAGLVTLMFGALAFGARAHESRNALRLSALCAAAVPMVKLPLAVFVVPTLLVYLALVDRRTAWRWLRWTVGSALVLTLPWHIWSLWTHGAEFWDVYIGYEILGRTGEAVLDEEATWWTHLLATWKSFGVFAPLVSLGALAALLGWPADAQERATRRLFVGYALFILVFFCFIKSKWPWYPLPAYPALAVLAAAFVADLARSRWAPAAAAAVGAPVLVRLLWIGTSPEYLPAARPARMWPLHSELYRWEAATTSPLNWGLALAVVALVALPWWKRQRARAALSTLLLGGIGLGLTLSSVAAVPREHRAPTSELMAALADEGIEHVVTVGFWPSETYGGRQTPLTSVYFLGLPGGTTTDGGDSFACLNEPLPPRTALVVHRASLKPKVRRVLFEKLRSLDPAPELWSLDPARLSGGFERVDWR